MKTLSFIVAMALAGLLRATPFYFPKVAIHSYDCNRCPVLSKEPLSAHWALNGAPQFNKALTRAESQSWQQWISGNALHQGVKILTLGNQAVIRLTPLEPQRISQLWSQTLQLKTSNGKTHTLKTIGAHSDGYFLPLDSEGEHKSLIVELSDAVGHGRFDLHVPEDIIPADSRWQLSVYDKNAPLQLEVETDKAQYTFGDRLKTTVTLKDGARFEPVEYLEVFVNNPAGKNFRMDLRETQPNVYQGSVRMRETTLTHGENWSLEVLCHQKREEGIAIRSAHTVFSYRVPSARVLSLQGSGESLWHYNAEVEVAQEGRYTLQMILYGQNKQGVSMPGEISQSSYWLEKGKHSVPIVFGKKEMMSLSAPYSIGNVKLLDLAQLKPVFYYEPLISVDNLFS